MNLKTKYHGTIEYKAEDVISFNKGLPGFENLRKFIMFSIEDNEVFNVLHSIDDTNVGLIVVSPFDKLKEYNVEINDNIIEDLKIEAEKDVVVYNTVTMNSDITKITSNLKAPIIININKKLGEQIILNDEKYQIKYPLFKE